MIQKFFEEKNKLLDFFGIKEEWHFYSIIDFKQFEWFINDDIIYYQIGKHNYSAKLFTHPDNGNSLYKRPQYTAVCMELYTSRVIGIFDNKKEKRPDLALL